VPERTGFAPMRKRSPAEVRALLADSSRRGGAPALSETAHHLHHYLHLTAALGANPEPVAPAITVEEHEVAAMRARFGVAAAANPLFGYNAGAEYGPAKRWPVERFVEVAARLHERTGGHSWIFGGPGDQELAGQLAAGIRAARPEAANAVSVLAGQTSLRELCAALRACDAVLTNDTGPMHLAAAVGTRIVALFGSTSPELTGPGLPGDERVLVLRESAPCAPCFLRECPVDFRCMMSLSVERVVEGMLRVTAR
jgi:heptosyltransferase-2